MKDHLIDQAPGNLESFGVVAPIQRRSQFTDPRGVAFSPARPELGCRLDRVRVRVAQTTSPAKAMASRTNGAKGGRPGMDDELLPPNIDQSGHTTSRKSARGARVEVITRGGNVGDRGRRSGSVRS